MMADTFLVRFSNIGARKVSWEERLPRPVDENQIVAAVRRKRVLMSQGIDAEFTGDSDYAGTIYVGGLRPVGKFLVVPGSNVL